MRSLELTPEESPNASVPEVIRVLLADSQGIYRVGIRRILALESDICLVAQASTFKELRREIQQNQVDIVLVEDELLIVPGSVQEITKVSSGVKVIVQTPSVEEERTVELYRRGICGIVSRSISPDLLVKCLRRIKAGETWIDNRAMNWILSAYRMQDTEYRNPRPKHRLSLKESVIIDCITQGMRNKQIAFQLGTTEQVIKNDLRKIYDKLGVTDRLELAIFSVQKKIVKPEVFETPSTQSTRQNA